ncbi:hypothetical protein PTKIN_Ptkin15bG0028900 [Pterospermum kingtungense]
MAALYEPNSNLKDNVFQWATPKPSRPPEALSESMQLIISVAASVSYRPISSQDPKVWGVLTAISDNARKRHQGLNILLTADNHCIGRLVEDRSFRIESKLVGGKHCIIYRKRITDENTQQSYSSVFLKDISNKGTFLNGRRLGENSPALKLKHGDIISFPVPPNQGVAFAYVYREVLRSAHSACPKRKADNLPFENKRLKVIGNSAPKGPTGAPQGLIGAQSGPIRAPKGPTGAPQGPINAPKGPTCAPQGPISAPKGPTCAPQGPIGAPKGPTGAPQGAIGPSKGPTGAPQGAIGPSKGPIGAPKGPITSPQGPVSAPKGPISLDDFRRSNMVSYSGLSNTELRKQLEYQVFTTDKLRNENRETMERHENAIKEIKESVANSYLDQLKELKDLLDVKQRELVEVNGISAEQKHAIEDLNERLNASMQSFTEANERMKIQKASIAELKVQLDGERKQRQEKREKATVDLKVAVESAQTETQKELQRLSDVALKREKEQRELVNKLEESLRESSSQVDGLMSKLEDTRQKLVNSDNKVFQLETQVFEARQASANARKKVEQLEHEMKGLRKELETEKAAREEAWAKVSVLEHEINAAMQDHYYERRLKGARERIMLRETQIQDFYSTTEEISVLFTKQQEQLKAMQRTLEVEKSDPLVKFDGVVTAPVSVGDTIGTECVLETESLGIVVQQNIDLNRCGTLGGDTMLDSSDTEDCAESNDDNGKVASMNGSISDAEIEGCDLADEDQKLNDVMDEDDELYDEDYHFVVG